MVYADIQCPQLIPTTVIIRIEVRQICVLLVGLFKLISNDGAH